MSLPLIGLDMDGVICTPFLGTNIAISRKLGLAPLPDSDAVRELTADSRRTYLRLRRQFESLRYFGRHPLPDVEEGLQALNTVRRPVLITGRSWHAKQLITHWLERHRLDGYFHDVLPNNTNLSTAHYKLWAIRRLGIIEHVDDDGSVAFYLANHGIRIFLSDWPRNRGLPYPGGVTKVHRLTEVALHLGAGTPKPVGL